MIMLYFIQYPEIDVTLDNKIKSLGKNMQIEKGWIVQSDLDAKAIHNFLTQDNPSRSILIFGLDKSNYYGRYSKDLWALFK
jgi:hypothetical protein